MNFRFSSAGSFLFSRQILFSLLLLLPLFSCQNEKQQKDSEIADLQKDVKQLSEENHKLLKEIQTLREEMKQPPPPLPPSDPTKTETAPSMTMDRMKAELEPLLKNIIENIKKREETPKKENQYGMRIEYDLKNAVYGLNNQSGDQPFAKVIIRYEKFLESGQDSRSYGKGSSSFYFAHQKDRWVFQSYE